MSDDTRGLLGCSDCGAVLVDYDVLLLPGNAGVMPAWESRLDR